MKDPLLTIGEAAEYVRLPVNTMRSLRQGGRGPRAGKLGRRVYYRQSDLDAWVAAAFDQPVSA